MFCPKCSQENANNAQFCFSCGERLPVIPTAPPSSSSDDYGGLQYIVPMGKNGPAVAARVCGLVSIIPCVGGLILGPAAIILGTMGLKKLREDPTMGFKGSALFGIITGSLMFVLNVVGIIMAILSP